VSSCFSTNPVVFTAGFTSKYFALTPKGGSCASWPFFPLTTRLTSCPPSPHTMNGTSKVLPPKVTGQEPLIVVGVPGQKGVRVKTRGRADCIDLAKHVRAAAMIPSGTTVLRGRSVALSRMVGRQQDRAGIFLLLDVLHLCRKKKK
jgi:hypothetical protein